MDVKICCYNNATRCVTCFKLRREQRASGCVPVSTQEYRESVPVSCCSHITVTGHTHTHTTAEINSGNAETLRQMKALYVNNCCMPCHCTGVSRDVIVRTSRQFYCRAIFRVFLSRSQHRTQKDMKYSTYRVPICTVATVYLLYAIGVLTVTISVHAVTKLYGSHSTVTVCDWSTDCHYISAHCYQSVRQSQYSYCM